MRRVLIASILLLSLALWQSIAHGIRIRQECDRLKTNRQALISGMETYRVRDSLQAATVQVMTVKAKELESHFSSVAALVKDMEVKLRRLESVSRTAVESRHEFSVPMHDTLILSQPAHSVRYDNGHISLEGIAMQGRFDGLIVSRDTLTQVVRRIPRRFLFFRWGTRGLRQEIVTSNPHSRIVYSRYLKIEK